LVLLGGQHFFNLSLFIVVKCYGIIFNLYTFLKLFICFIQFFHLTSIYVYGLYINYTYGAIEIDKV